jgi:ribosomal protein S18 acetylase RimI-like enzyme
VALASQRDLGPAVQVWQAANAARGRVPTAERIARVQRKVRAADALLVVAHGNGTVVAMALAEPGREDDGGGEIVPGYGHISMVFVAPHLWGRGIGSTLLSGLHQHVQGRGWTCLTLWTREDNTRAQRLYAASGYRCNGRSSKLPSGEQILQLQWP